MPSFLRFATFAVALLAASTTGRAQGFAPRAQPAYPSGYPQGLPATNGVGQPAGVGAGGGVAPERMSIVDPDKKLSAGDQVTLEIIEDRDGGLPRVVTAAGELDVPPLGRVRVSGKTVVEAASQIKQLLERDYYYHATVRLAIDRVSPVQVRSGVVYLSGQIRLGGPQDMISGEVLTLSNAILKAGGVSEWGDGTKVQLTRQKKEGGVDVIKANFDKIIEKGDASQDPVLQDGDRIFIPKSVFRFK
jgi:protein involved in polysaccharide export with SLBB domain